MPDKNKLLALSVNLINQKKGTNGDIIYKYDIRLFTPNEGAMSPKGFHTFEHFACEHFYSKFTDLIDFSPMACRTGFILVCWDFHQSDEIKKETIKLLKHISHYKSNTIPFKDEYLCGNSKEHSLKEAKYYSSLILNLSLDSI